MVDVKTNEFNMAGVESAICTHTSDTSNFHKVLYVMSLTTMLPNAIAIDCSMNINVCRCDKSDELMDA